MQIIENIITKTQQDIVKEELAKINRHDIDGIDSLENCSLQAYNLFWYNPRVTPQEFCDMLGTNAYKLFIKHAKVEAFIADDDIRPTHTPLGIPKDKEVIFNQDGSIKINDKPLEENNNEVNE